LSELEVTLVAVGSLVTVVTAGQLIVIRFLVTSFQATLERNTAAIDALRASL